ncbi:MAG: hypothetical protein ACLQAT_09740 [Candidatus Binataceae bacterium]
MGTSKDIELELEGFYRNYIDLFNSENFDRFLDCFTRPYVSITGARGINVVANDAAYATDFRGIMAALKGRGWARSDIVRIKSWPLDDNLGMIVADVIRFKADATVLEEVRACYLVRRENQAWKIATISEVKPPFRGPGDIPRH